MNRGFLGGEFKDGDGTDCIIQESSAVEKPYLWLGCKEPEPKVLAFKINGGTPAGWVPLPLPPGVTMDDIICNDRMHLTRKQAKMLIPLLQKFVDTGGLK